MINATELRIGNYAIYHGETDMLCKLDAQDILNIATGHMENDLLHSPIPLTPDILVKCGFKDMGKYWVKNWGQNGFEIIKYDEYYKGFVIELGKGRTKYIEHLHQLQNLIHSLTGEELTIKL